MREGIRAGRRGAVECREARGEERRGREGSRKGEVGSRGSRGSAEGEDEAAVHVILQPRTVERERVGLLDAHEERNQPKTRLEDWWMRTQK